MNPVVEIEYSSETQKALEALYSTNENDADSTIFERAKNVVQYLPCSYTAWHFYFKHFPISSAEREEEEGFVSSLLQDMPKNYQIWNFRRQMFMKRQSKASDELSASAQALIQDHKNYHSWAHRQIVRKEEASEENWSSELNFVHQMLEDDPFNNSAWNQRAFVIRHLTSDHRNADLEAAFALVKNVPHCASGWNYLLWILFQYSPTRIKEAISFCHEVLKDQPHCVPCLEFLSELYFALGLQIHDDKVKSQCFASCERIWGACMKWDPVRFSYWRSRQRRLAALEPTTSV